MIAFALGFVSCGILVFAYSLIAISGRSSRVEERLDQIEDDRKASEQTEQLAAEFEQPAMFI